MLQSFPDYGKSPPEYVASITQIMTTFAAHVQERISDLRYGLPSKLKYLPTVSDVVEMGDKILHDETEAASFKKRFSGQIMRGELTSPKFIPFKQLWAAFEGEEEILQHVTFDQMDSACRLLVMEGKDAARLALTGGLKAKNP